MCRHGFAPRGRGWRYSRAGSETRLLEFSAWTLEKIPPAVTPTSATTAICGDSRACVRCWTLLSRVWPIEFLYQPADRCPASQLSTSDSIAASGQGLCSRRRSSQARNDADGYVLFVEQNAQR